MRKSASEISKGNAQAPTVLSDAETDHVAGGNRGGVPNWPNNDGLAIGGGVGAQDKGNGTSSSGRFGV
jgi:hypothetical protein